MLPTLSFDCITLSGSAVIFLESFSMILSSKHVNVAKKKNPHLIKHQSSVLGVSSSRMCWN